MKFIKEHLSGSDYDWELSSHLHSMKEMVPTRNRFDRFNGNCVLHMLNLFDKLVMNLTVQDGQYLELLIMSQLPLEAKSEVVVFNWLKDKYVYSLSAKKAN